jgi:protein arginine N-methyltransferase 2
MEEESTKDADTDLQTQLILLAASHHNLESLRTLLHTGSASVQDLETGFTPLHAAISACEDSSTASSEAQDGSTHASLPDGLTNGAVNGESKDAGETDVEAAAKTVKLLLQNGAIWNDVDNDNETPGCLALRLDLKVLYEIMVDAGVRAEMLLNRLDEYEQLADDVESEEEAEAEPERTGEEERDHEAAMQQINGHSETEPVEQEGAAPNVPTEPKNEDYLQSQLRFQDGRILDDSNNGVMMAWETYIMKRTADLLAPKQGLRILNIGHGMGIVDTFFQEKEPIAHHIVEAHPAVLARMKKDGWYERPDVTIHEGRWQDIVPRIMEQGILFDAIYFDTFAEDYKVLRDFFSDSIIGLLDDGGKWGFFNGLGADRQICYDVYGKVVEMDLFEAGFDTEWETIEVLKMDETEWEGIKRRYWTPKEYKLPVCEFIG